MENSKLRQLTAKTLKKWENIINGGDEGECEYCVAFNRFMGCFNCPILSDTGVHGCNNTPYYEWADDPTTENAWIEYTYLELVAYSQGIHPNQKAKP